MQEEGALRGQQHQHRRQCASRGSRGWWVQRALRLCVRSHKEPFWQRLRHQLPKLLVPASWGVLTSHCYSYEAMCMGFTAVTKRSGIDGQNQEDWISRLGWWSERRRSKWLKGKNNVTALNCRCECDSLCFQFHSHSFHTLNISEHFYSGDLPRAQLGLHSQTIYCIYII